MVTYSSRNSVLLKLVACNPLYIQAMMPLGALVGSPIGGMVADWMSRKRSLMLSGIPNFAGWILIVFAQYSRNPVVFKGLLLVGRFITGIATGWMTSPITVRNLSDMDTVTNYSLLSSGSHNGYNLQQPLLFSSVTYTTYSVICKYSHDSRW